MNTAEQAGLLLFYNDRIFCGVGLSEGELHTYKVGREQIFPPAGSIGVRSLFMRAHNQDDVVTFSYSIDGATWVKVASFEVSGYNHNMGDGFLSLRPALFAVGAGEAKFRKLEYKAA